MSEEGELDDANRKLRLLEQFLEHTDDAFQVSLEDGTLYYINEEASNRLGINKEEASEYTVSDFEVGFKTEEDWLEHVRELKEKGSLLIESENVNQKTGNKIRVEVQVRYEVIGGQGYVIAISRDVSRAKKAEKKFLNQKLMTNYMLNSIRDGVSILDPDGVHVEVNNALCKMTGYSEEELIGDKVPHKYWPEEQIADIISAFEKTKSGDFKDFELIFKKKSGERFPVIAYPSPILDDEGNITGYVATVKDISKRKEQEKRSENPKKNFDQYSNLPVLVSGIMI